MGSHVTQSNYQNPHKDLMFLEAVASASSHPLLSLLSTISFVTICQMFLVLAHLKSHAFLISLVWIAFSLDINIAHFPLPFSYTDEYTIFFL